MYSRYAINSDYSLNSETGQGCFDPNGTGKCDNPKTIQGHATEVADLTCPQVDQICAQSVHCDQPPHVYVRGRGFVEDIGGGNLWCNIANEKVPATVVDSFNGISILECERSDVFAPDNHTIGSIVTVQVSVTGEGGEYTAPTELFGGATFTTTFECLSPPPSPPAPPSNPPPPPSSPPEPPPSPPPSPPPPFSPPLGPCGYRVESIPEGMAALNTNIDAGTTFTINSEVATTGQGSGGHFIVVDPETQEVLGSWSFSESDPNYGAAMVNFLESLEGLFPGKIVIGSVSKEAATDPDTDFYPALREHLGATLVGPGSLPPWEFLAEPPGPELICGDDAYDPSLVGKKLFCEKDRSQEGHDIESLNSNTVTSVYDCAMRCCQGKASNSNNANTCTGFDYQQRAGSRRSRSSWTRWNALGGTAASSTTALSATAAATRSSLAFATRAPPTRRTASRRPPSRSRAASPMPGLRRRRLVL